MTRTNYVAAQDARAKLLEIGAMMLGGTAEDYDLANERVVAKADASRSISFGEAAAKAVELGGRYDGSELPENINPMTIASATTMAGTGLMGVAKDELERVGTVAAHTAGFAEVEVDLETGRVEIIDYLGYADCGTVVHPQGLAAQMRSGAIMGFGLALTERHVYDPAYGRPNARGYYQAKPPSYMDVPAFQDWGAVDEVDFQNPMGMKGIGEPIQGAASAAILCAVSDALGGHLFNRTPVVTDMILNAAEGLPQSHKPLATNTV
jgi:CO/xanthine dehydrogenase Mo-binding subunit